MPSKIKVYMNNPTAGLRDGDLVSTDTGLAPILSGSIKVPTSGHAEGSWVKLALRCDVGYETILDEARHALIEIEGDTIGEGESAYDNADKWQLAADDGDSPDTPEDWGDPLAITDEIDDTNYIFWARARVHEDEEPENDDTVDLRVTATIGAAEEEVGEEEVAEEEEELGEEEIGEEELGEEIP
jgi:hypothetical protein